MANGQRHAPNDDEVMTADDNGIELVLSIERTGSHRNAQHASATRDREVDDRQLVKADGRARASPHLPKEVLEAAPSEGQRDRRLGAPSPREASGTAHTAGTAAWAEEFWRGEELRWRWGGHQHPAASTSS
eukprot:Skav229994  [mRNA]  locus=scaffold17:34069:36642:- [translate_table: standard]